MFCILKNLFAKKDTTKLQEAIFAGAILVDVRTAAEFSSGTAQDAVNIPVNMLSKNIEMLKTNRPIIVFCKSGARSALAKRTLEKNGLKNVMDGGSWKNIASLQEKPIAQ